MAVEIADDFVVDLLNNRWDKNNTSQIKPTIKTKNELKSTNYMTDPSKGDLISTYSKQDIPSIISLGATHRQVVYSVSIELVVAMQGLDKPGTTKGRFKQHMDEIDRILNSQKKNPKIKDTDSIIFDFLNQLGWIPLTSGYKGIYKWVCDIHLVKSSEAI